MKPRKYQSEAIELLKKSIARGNKKVMLALPTGAGKSIVAREVVRMAKEKNSQVLFLAHRIILIDQMKRVLSDFDNVVVETLQTSKNKLHDDIKIVIIDEGHWSANSNIQQDVMSKYPNAITIGMSATPITASGHRLKSWETVVSTVQTIDLVNAGFLSNVKVLAPVNLDRSGFKVTAGEYNIKDVGKEVTKSTIVNGVVEKYIQYADGLKTLVFCVNVEHSELMSEEFRKYGYKSAHYHSKMNKREREIVLDNFKEGKITVLTNVETLTTGFDVPDIYCGIFATPTKSIVKAVQCYGRLLRLDPNNKNKTALILDCGNVIQDTIHPLDIIDFEREPERNNTCKICEGETKIINQSVREEDGIFIKITVRECIECKNIETKESAILDNILICEECDEQIEKGESNTITKMDNGSIELFSVCPHCGHETPLRSIKAIDTDLEEIEATIIMKNCETWDDIRDQLRKATNAEGKLYHHKWSKIAVKLLEDEGFTVDEVKKSIDFYTKNGWGLGGIPQAMINRRDKVG